MKQELEELGYPPEIISSIEDLREDIKFDKFDTKGVNGYVIFGFHKIMEKRIALKYYYYGDREHEEVQLLTQCKSPSIIQILNARSIGNGFAYFMTNEVNGGDLDNFIQSPNKSLIKAIRITRKILDGVSDMHKDEFRILHRDLKPANILLDTSLNPFIADFGSVKKLPDGQAFINGSKHAALYRPPESYDDEYYKSSDLFQVGLVLYQLLGGYFPYDGKAYLNKKQTKEFNKLTSGFDKSKFIDGVLQKKCQKGNLTDLDSLPRYVDKKLKRIIKKAINPNPNSRYQSASEFDLALHELGVLNNWKIENEEYLLVDCNNKDYRIINEGLSYKCIKSKTRQNSWRKEGKIKAGSESEVLDQLIKHVE